MVQARRSRYFEFSAFCVFAFILSACDTTTVEKKPSSSASATPTAAVTYASGARAAKIIFKTTSSGGSFDTPTSNGTAAASGLLALKAFDTASTPTEITWPSWISSVEIGITGTATGTNADCARFSNADAASCDYDEDDSGADTVPCAGPDAYYRISEFDCNGTATTLVGNGTSADRVYIRTTFNRAALSATENINAVLEYASSTLNAAPTDPAGCVGGGICADMEWKAFLTPSAATQVSPFLMLVPPAISVRDRTFNGSGSGGGSIGTKQFILPLAPDSTLSVFQLSRIRAIAASEINEACVSNSALCVGMVFYSLTFYRI